MAFRTVTIEPELVLEHKGIRVYRTYVNDDADQPEKFYFTTNPEDTDSASVLAFLVTVLDTPAARALLSQRPKPINAPLGVDLVEFRQTEAYFNARIEWDKWFDITQPQLILQALREGIEQGIIS